MTQQSVFPVTVKKTQPITKQKPLPTIRPWFEDNYTWRQKPISETHLIALGEELIDTIEKNPRIRTIKAFLALKKLHPRTWRKWCEEYDTVQKYNEYAKMMLAIRREDGGLEGTLNPGMISFVMPHYSDEWEDALEKRSKAKTPAGDTGSGNITVVLPPLQVSND